MATLSTEDNHPIEFPFFILFYVYSKKQTKICPLPCLPLVVILSRRILEALNRGLLFCLLEYRNKTATQQVLNKCKLNVPLDKMSEN